MSYRGMDKTPEVQRKIEDLYGAYRVDLKVFVSSAVKNSYAVEDIVQDVFLEALKKYDSFKTHPNQSGWLYRTAMYKIKEYERRMRAISQVDIAGENVTNVDSEMKFLETELNMILDKSLTPEEHRRYVRYFRIGYSVEEIAEFEGVTVNNMRVRLTRLKKKLLQLAKTGTALLLLVIAALR